MQPYPDSMESVGFGGPERKNQYVAQQQAQESLFLEELTQRLSQMGPSSSSQQGERRLIAVVEQVAFTLETPSASCG